MNLPTYIENIGDKAASELFGISQRAAMSYRLRQRIPRPDLAKRIVEKTNGKVDWEGIYSPHQATAA